MLMFIIGIVVVLASAFPFVVLEQPVLNWFLLFTADAVIITAGWIFKKDFLEKNLFSPRSIFAGLTILHFGFPSILLSYENSFVNKANYEYLDVAILLIFVALIFYYLGFKFIYGNTVHIKLEDKKQPFDDNRTKRAIYFLLLLGYVSRVYIIVSGGYFQLARATQAEELKGVFYSIFYIVEEFPMYALLLATIVLWSKKEDRSKSYWKYLSIVIAFSELLYWLISGRKEQTIMAFLYPVIVYNIMTLKLPSKKAIITFAIFLMLYFPFNFYYRYLLEVGELGGANPIEVITNPEFLFQLTQFEGSDNQKGGILERINLMESVAGCIEIIEKQKWDAIPGENYFAAVYSIVPRFIWESKPEFHYGNEFGHLIGMLYPKDVVTSISVTFIGEAYLNFRFFGVFVIGAFGLFFGFFYKQIFNSKHYSIWLFIYLVILPTLLYFGGTFTLYFAGLLKLVPFSYLVGYYCLKK